MLQRKIFRYLPKIRFMLMKYLGFTVLLFVVVMSISCDGGNKSSETRDSVVRETGYPEVDLLTEKIFEDTKDPDLLYKRSIAYMDIEAYDNAISDMYIAMKMDSLRPKYYVHLADVFMKYSRSSQALETIRLAAERFPENINILLRYAELSLTLRQNQKAIQVIQQVLERDGENAEAYFLMGLLMNEEGDVDRAKGAFRRVVDIDPEVVDAYILLGELHEQDDPKMALQYLNNAVTVDPQNINALHSKAFFLQNNDNVLEALTIYDEIHVIDSNYPPAYLNAGILYLEREEFEKAREQFNILLSLEPDNHRAYYFRGLAYLGQEKISLAKADFEQSLKIKPDYQNASDELSRMK